MEEGGDGRANLGRKHNDDDQECKDKYSNTDRQNFHDAVLIIGQEKLPHLRELDGPTLAQRLSFFAFDPTFTGGIWVG